MTERGEGSKEKIARYNKVKELAQKGEERAAGLFFAIWEPGKIAGVRVETTWDSSKAEVTLAVIRLVGSRFYDTVRFNDLGEVISAGFVDRKPDTRSKKDKVKEKLGMTNPLAGKKRYPNVYQLWTKKAQEERAKRVIETARQLMEIDTTDPFEPTDENFQEYDEILGGIDPSTDRFQPSGLRS